MNWKTIKFRDFLHRSKLPVDITDKESYKRVTIRIKHQGVSLRDTEIGKKIGTKKQFILKGGQFIMSKIDARQGAFGIAPDEVDGAIITGNFWAYDVNQDLVSIDWLNQYTNSAAFYDVCERASSGITHRKYLDEQAFLNHKIQIPYIKEQLLLVKQIGAKKAAFTGIFNEVGEQLTHLTKLRQALLREAMQGQLLPQDPTDEPAALLLKKLQASKAATAKGGKGKAGALFAEEAEAVEGPFEIPASWVWCKLGDVSNNVEYGTSEKASLDSKGVPVLRMNNIQNGEVLIDNLKYLPQGIADLPKLFLKTNDLLFNRTNSAELVGKAGIYKGEDDKMTFASYLIRVQFSLSVTAFFANYFINSHLCRATEIEPFVIQQNGQANFNGTKLKDIRIPLPPLAEQHRIVANLEQLLQHCDALEHRIRENRRLAEQLLQTALREALAPPAGTEPAAETEAELAEVEPASPALRRGRPLKKRLAANDPDLFSDLADLFGVE